MKLLLILDLITVYSSFTIDESMCEVYDVLRCGNWLNLSEFAKRDPKYFPHRSLSPNFRPGSFQNPTLEISPRRPVMEDIERVKRRKSRKAKEDVDKILKEFKETNKSVVCEKLESKRRKRRKH